MSWWSPAVEYCCCGRDSTISSTTRESPALFAVYDGAPGAPTALASCHLSCIDSSQLTMPSSTPRQGSSALNEDILHHIASFLHPDDLAQISHAARVFFYEHMKNAYTSLTFCKRDKLTKKFLLHLSYVLSWLRYLRF